MEVILISGLPGCDTCNIGRAMAAHMERGGKSTVALDQEISFELNRAAGYELIIHAEKAYKENRVSEQYRNEARAIAAKSRANFLDSLILSVVEFLNQGKSVVLSANFQARDDEQFRFLDRLRAFIESGVEHDVRLRLFHLKPDAKANLARLAERGLPVDQDILSSPEGMANFMQDVEHSIQNPPLPGSVVIDQWKYGLNEGAALRTAIIAEMNEPRESSTVIAHDPQKEKPAVGLCAQRGMAGRGFPGRPSDHPELATPWSPGRTPR